MSNPDPESTEAEPSEPSPESVLLYRLGMIVLALGAAAALFIHGRAIQAASKSASQDDPAMAMRLEDSKRDTRNLEEIAGPMGVITYRITQALGTPTGEAATVLGVSAVVAIGLFAVARRL